MIARCREGRVVRISQLRGQNLRVVFAGDNLRKLDDDPRLVTVAVTADSFAGADCVAEPSGVREAYAMLSDVSPDQLPGTQFLIDRDGWLRARALPNAKGWSASDNLCTSTRGNSLPVQNGGGDGLGALIARFDSEPVLTARGRGRH